MALSDQLPPSPSSQSFFFCLLTASIILGRAVTHLHCTTNKTGCLVRHLSRCAFPSSWVEIFRSCLSLCIFLLSPMSCRLCLLNIYCQSSNRFAPFQLFFSRFSGALKKSLTAEQVQADFITLGRSSPRLLRVTGLVTLYYINVSLYSLIGLSEEKATYFSEKVP